MTVLALLATGALVAGGSFAGAALALAAGGLPVALIALAVHRDRPDPRLGLALAALLVVLAGGLGTLVALRGHVAELPWPGGMPLVATVLLAGLWLLPLALTTALYAATFDRHGLAADDLERLRRGRDGGGGPAPRREPATAPPREPPGPAGRGAR